MECFFFQRPGAGAGAGAGAGGPGKVEVTGPDEPGKNQNDKYLSGQPGWAVLEVGFLV